MSNIENFNNLLKQYVSLKEHKSEILRKNESADASILSSIKIELQLLEVQMHELIKD